jgi:hypothetical protein
MSRPIITISINDATPVAVESIGCQVGARTRYNQAADTLPLTFPRTPGQAFPIAYNDDVKISLDGTPYFAGKAGQPRARQAAEKGSASVTVFGPWKLLDRWPALRVATTNSPAITDVVANASQWTPRWTLFSYPSFSGLAPAGYAVIQLLYGPEYLTRSAPHFVSGLIPFGVLPSAAVEINGSTVAAAMQMALRQCPDVAVYFDYSTSPPTMKFVRMTDWGSEPSYAFTRVGTPWSLATGTHDFYEAPTALSLADVSEYDLAPAHELNPPVLALRTEAGGGSSTQWEPAASLANAPDVLWILNTLGTPASGTAANLYNSRGGLRTDGEFVLRGDRPDLTIHPGQLWTLSGDDAATGVADGAVAWTQSVTDNLATGETRVSLGFPRWLGEGDRLGNWFWCRKVGFSNAS